MSQEFYLDAEPRADAGKGASRRLRRAERVPAIVYGGDTEPAAISLPHNQVLHRLENEAFYSHVITLKMQDGAQQEVVLRDLQRHPAKAKILHMDFQRISKDREVHVHVPLHFLHEDKCEGVKLQGGMLNKALTEVEISCLPQHLPEFIEVDIATLQAGQALHLSAMILPEGVSLTALSHGSEHDAVVVMVHKPRGGDDDAAAEADDAAAGDDSSGS